VIDEFGFDPLRDDLMNVLDPDSYRWHTVAQTEFSNPQRIKTKLINHGAPLQPSAEHVVHF
jgi:hypothetical protein